MAVVVAVTAVVGIVVVLVSMVAAFCLCYPESANVVLETSVMLVL